MFAPLFLSLELFLFISSYDNIILPFLSLCSHHWRRFPNTPAAAAHAEGPSPRHADGWHLGVAAAPHCCHQRGLQARQAAGLRGARRFQCLHTHAILTHIGPRVLTLFFFFFFLNVFFCSFFMSFSLFLFVEGVCVLRKGREEGSRQRQAGISKICVH